MKMYRRQTKKGRIFALFLALALTMAPAFSSYADTPDTVGQTSGEEGTGTEETSGEEKEKVISGEEPVETPGDKKNNGSGDGDLKDDPEDDPEEGDISLQSENGEGTVGKQAGDVQTQSTFEPNAPVIQKIDFKQNGQTVKNNALLTLDLLVFDESAISNIEVLISSEENGYTRWMECEEIPGAESLKEHQYKCTFQLDGTEKGRLIIDSIRVVDEHSNMFYSSYREGQEYWVDVEASEESEPIHVKSLTFPKNGASLDEIDAIAEGIKLETQEKIEDRYVYLSFEGVDRRKCIISLSSQQDVPNNSVFADAHIYQDSGRGEYTLKDVYVQRGNFSMETSLVMEDKEKYSFTITKDPSYNVSGPKVKLESVVLENNGQNVKQGDKVGITLSVTSSGSEELPEYATIGFCAAAQNIDSPYAHADNVALGDDGKYHGTLDTQNLYPCEWYIDQIQIGSDCFYEGSFPDEGICPYYINVYNGQAFVNPTYNWEIQFLVLDESGHYTPDSTIHKTVERRQTFKEAGITFPTVTSGYSDFQFVGWMDSEGKDITEDTPLINETAFMQLYAKYDKGIKEIAYRYPNNEGQWDYEYQSVVYKNGQTYADLSADIQDFRPENLTDKYKFAGWKFESYYAETDVVSGVGNMLTATASFSDVTILQIERNYIDSQGRDSGYNGRELFAVKQGTTVGEVIDMLKQYDKPETYEGLRFKNWDVAVYIADVNEGDAVQDGQMFAMNAVYDNCLVRYSINYYKEVGGIIYTSGKTFCQLAEKGDTVTALTTFDGITDIRWNNAPPEKFVVKENMTFRGWGTFLSTEPDQSADPDEPSGSDKPTEPSDPGSTSKPSNPSSGSSTGSKPGKKPNTSTDSPASDTEDNPYVTPESKLPDSVVNSVVEAVNAAVPGQEIVINMNTKTTVSKEILEAARGKNVNVILQMDGYSWTINGMSIQSTNLQDINLQVTKNTDHIPSATVRSLAGDNPCMQISLVHEGNFGFQASLNIDVGAEYCGKYGNLYYYDSAGKMVFMNAGQIGADGYVSLAFSHASDYLIVMSDQMMSQTDVPSQLTPSNIDQGQNGSVSASSVSTNSIESVKTGDNDTLCLWITLCIAAMGTMVYQFKKKQA